MIKSFRDKSLNHSALEHGFFGRRGGTSKGIYQGLNVGLGSDDNKDDVYTNRLLLTNELGITPSKLHTLYQIHSNKVICLEKEDDICKDIEADGMVTNLKGHALGILTADCTPVLFADTKARVIGAAHAGWQGALSGILENTVLAMEKLGAKRPNIKAVIGPCIYQINYEVGLEFRRKFLNINPEFDPLFKKNDKGLFQFDLMGFNFLNLKRARIGSAKCINLDTYAMEDDFFSFRRTTHRSESDYGRQISIILLT